MQIRASSTEFAKEDIYADHDITGLVVEVSLPPKGTEPVDWLAAEVVEVVETVADKEWRATIRVLLGPGGVKTLTRNRAYGWYVHATDNPEAPELYAGEVLAT
jgi:hypothetical protein